MPQNALIFSPGLDGHRQVYVFVIAQILKELGFNIYILGNTREITPTSFYCIKKLEEESNITIIDTSKYPKDGFEISIQEFLELQNSLNPSLTIFPEADCHLRLLTSQVFKKNKLKGKIVGIFMRPFYSYHEKMSIVDKLKYIKHLIPRLKKDESLFYDFFLKRFSILDTALCIDEKFVANHSYIKWLPDVFQQYTESILKDEKTEERIWIEKLDQFTEKNKDKFHFLYFGTAQYRRGYDILLNLAQKTGGCFIHCGLMNNNTKSDYNTSDLRSSLSKDGRLFETNQYLSDSLTIKHFFKSISHLILPYRKFYGSSGVMLQALELGIPVLAPNIGIIGYRIKEHNLGMTFNSQDMTSLETQFDQFKNINPESFNKNIETYMNFQTIEQLKRVLINSFKGSDIRIIEPILSKV